MLHEVTCLLQDGRHHQDHQEGERRQPGVERGVLVPCGAPPRQELQAKVRKHFTITINAPIKGFSCLKVPSSVITFKTLFKHLVTGIGQH